MKKKPIRYFIQGKEESGKTIIIKEWLERSERMNGVYLSYEGENGTPIIRLDYGKRKIKEYGDWINKKIAIFEKMNNYREIYKIKIIDAIKMNMDIIIISRNPQNRIRKRLNDILKGFIIFDLDRISDTIKTRKEIMLGMMRYPIIKHPYKYIRTLKELELNEKKTRKPIIYSNEMY